jgi:hypothetical protein
MADSKTTTGTRDSTYDLISIAYHALQEAEIADRYARDAERDGDGGLAAFFREIQQAGRQRAERAKEMLGDRLGRAAGRAMKPAAAAFAGSRPGGSEQERLTEAQVEHPPAMRDVAVGRGWTGGDGL